MQYATAKEKVISKSGAVRNSFKHPRQKEYWYSISGYCVKWEEYMVLQNHGQSWRHAIYKLDTGVKFTGTSEKFWQILLKLALQKTINNFFDQISCFRGSGPFLFSPVLERNRSFISNKSYWSPQTNLLVIPAITVLQLVFRTDFFQE